MPYNRTRAEREPTHLAWSPLTKMVYLIKGNGAREDFTQRFLGFCDQSLPLPRKAKEAIAEAVGLALPPVSVVPPCTRDNGGCTVHGLDERACAKVEKQRQRDLAFSIGDSPGQCRNCRRTSLGQGINVWDGLCIGCGGRPPTNQDRSVSS